MSECTHNCSTCGSACAEKEKKPQSLIEPLNKNSKVKKVIAVMSGKGGVGKSFITSMLAVDMAKKGKNCAILDADITGPSIPKAFGIYENARANEDGLIPAISETGIKVMSTNLLLPDETDPVVWRGPVIAGMVKQFWTDTLWGDVDYMFVDMPPGTGDVPLTVFQSLPVDGIIIVTSPQDLVSMIVEKAVKMAQLMNIKILGIIENYSYFTCPNCNEKHYIYGESEIENIADEYDIKLLAQIPINTMYAKMVDEGRVEDIATDFIKLAIDEIENV